MLLFLSRYQCRNCHFAEAGQLLPSATLTSLGVKQTWPEPRQGHHSKRVVHRILRLVKVLLNRYHSLRNFPVQIVKKTDEANYLHYILIQGSRKRLSRF